MNLKKKDNTVVVAMSGGVDSSVAAALLKQEGYNVIGMTMHLWDYDRVGGNIMRESSCCSLKAMDDARIVCHKLGAPHYVIDLREEFEQEVIQNFIDEYLKGRTPNPCILCNSRMKWTYLARKVRQLGARWLATGHYARVKYNSHKERYLLLKSNDALKDQSYALWGLTQEQLRQTLLPLGNYHKTEVRLIAQQLDLKTKDKPESQEICFIPDNDYPRFLKKKIPRLEKKVGKGEILDTEGRVLGQHRGYPFYTVGQRKGLGIALGRPVYVTRIDAERNRIIVGSRDDLKSQGLIAEAVNWIAIEQLTSEMEVEVKIRYNDRGAPGTVIPLPDGRVKVVFNSPRRAVTPGQSVVFYNGEVVVGGGIISTNLIHEN